MIVAKAGYQAQVIGTQSLYATELFHSQGVRKGGSSTKEAHCLGENFGYFEGWTSQSSYVCSYLAV